jgi:hypothetical protein
MTSKFRAPRSPAAFSASWSARTVQGGIWGPPYVRGAILPRAAGSQLAGNWLEVTIREERFIAVGSGLPFRSIKRKRLYRASRPAVRIPVAVSHMADSRAEFLR